MGTSEEEDERNLEYFQRKKLPWLRTFFQERGIQTCSEGKGENDGRRTAAYTTPIHLVYPLIEFCLSSISFRDLPLLRETIGGS